MNWIYLAGSMLGVGLMVGLSALLFGTRTTRLASIADAARCLMRDIAGFRMGDGALDADGASALVENARDGALHLVLARGDGFVSRTLRPGTLKRVARNDCTLTLRMADFTLPRAALTLADEAAAQAWEARLARAVA